MHRGSRKHILDWVEQPVFAAEVTTLLEPTGAEVSRRDRWMPAGHTDDREVRLSRHGQQLFADTIDWDELRRWWLVHNGRANTPNWDLAASCLIGGQKGIVLVEAKAHDAELKTSGKSLSLHASRRSKENHVRIGEAIGEASEALGGIVPGVSLSIKSHYQLANRVVFSWKLASMGLPVVLVYLGFLGDTDIADVGEPFSNDAHWQRVFREHLGGVIPSVFLEREIDCGSAVMWMIVRSRPVVS